MCKLIEEPRIPTELVPKTKKRLKRTKQAKEGVEIKYTLIRDQPNSRVNQLFELYKLDKYKARVKYLSSPENYKSSRTCIFESGEKDFEVCEFDNKFGISVTNKMYSSQKKTNSVMFKNGKFYHYINSPLRNKRKGVMPLTHWGFLRFIKECEGVGFSHNNDEQIVNSKTFQIFVNKFPWIKTLHETEAAYGLAYNTIQSKGLTGQKDLLRHVFKVPINIAKVIIKEVPSSYSRGDRHYLRATNRARSPFEHLKQWKEVSKVLDGVQNLTEEFYHHHYFYDTCNMAHKLGRKVNCRWGIKKLEEMHDEWSKDLRNILLDCEIEYMLKVRKPYYGLAKHTGWKLLFTNKEMLVEGVRQNHCVGSYIDRVERGECAIFHIDGFTLQVGMERTARVEQEKGYTVVRALTPDGVPVEQIDAMLLNDVEVNEKKPKFYYKLTNLQFRGLRNCDPSKELRERVNQLLDEYSLSEECQDICEARYADEDMKAICDEVHKTKWTVVINHETQKYEIADNGLNGLEVKPALDIKKPAPAFQGGNLVGYQANNYQANNYQEWGIRDEALPF